MKSIRSKLIVLSLSSVLFTSAVQGSAGLFGFKKMTESDSARIMNLICAEQAQKLNNLFLRVEQSASLLEGHATRGLKTAGSLMQASEQREEFAREIASACYNVASHTEGALSAFVRFSPDVAPSDFGSYCHVDAATGTFQFLSPTDLASYRPDEHEHVGWFYEPAAAGRPLWMKPYFNANTNQRIISYVIPLYHEGRFVGVAGLDVKSTHLKEAVTAMRYEKGTAFLADEEGTVVYHPHLKAGTPKPESMWTGPAIAEEFKGTDAHSLQSYELDGVDKLMAYRSLRNGMRLVLACTVDDLYRESRELMRKTFWQLCAMTLIFGALALWIAGRIAAPLRELASAMRRMAAGDLDVEIKHGSHDEIGQLAEVFRDMTVRLKAHVSNISGLAYKDALTGVRNRAAFLEEQAERQKSMLKDSRPFALMVLDVNGLKRVNDSFGHAAGDRVIMLACRAICRTFKHSPVFRIGGDEFVVLLEGADLASLDWLCRSLQSEIDEMNQRTDLNVPLSLAYGVARSGEVAGESFEELLRRADRKMYLCKTEMKKALGQEQR